MEQTTQTPQEPGKMNPLVIVAILAVIAIGAYMVLGKQNTTQTEEAITQQEAMIEETTPAETTTNENLMQESDVVEVIMEAGAYYYTPKEIRVKQGQTVRIEFTAVDMMHDFNIDELNVDGPVVKSGESTTIEFVADQAGEFEYYCSVADHRIKGQIGSLIVE